MSRFEFICWKVGIACLLLIARKLASKSEQEHLEFLAEEFKSAVLEEQNAPYR